MDRVWKVRYNRITDPKELPFLIVYSKWAKRKKHWISSQYERTGKIRFVDGYFEGKD